MTTGRAMAEDRKELLALVLQGGGSLGSYQGGAYEQLFASQQNIDWVAGISIGAINGAIICGNPPERRVEKLRQFWLQNSSELKTPPLSGDPTTMTLFNETSAAMTATIGVPGFFAPRVPPPLPGWSYDPTDLSYYDTHPLHKTLLELVDFDLLNSGAVRYSVGAVNVQTGNFRYFDTKYEKIGPEHVMASGALPPGLPMIQIDGDYYWDGGVVSNTPLQYVLDYEHDHEDVCIFQIDLFNARGDVPKSMIEIDQREKDIRYSSRTRLNTDLMCRMRNLGNAVRRLADKLPEDLRDDPDWRFLEQAGPQTSTTIVHLIHRRCLSERASRDYEFSRFTMERNWKDGKADVETTLKHPKWVKRERKPGAVVTLDLTKDGSDA